MDPISVFLSLAGLASICATVSKRVYTFFGSSDDEDQALQSLKCQVDSLQQVIKPLEIALKSIRPNSQPWLCIAQSLSECQRTMEIVDSMFNGKTGRVVSIFENYVNPDCRSNKIAILAGEIAAQRQNLTISLVM